MRLCLTAILGQLLVSVVQAEDLLEECGLCLFTPPKKTHTRAQTMLVYRVCRWCIFVVQYHTYIYKYIYHIGANDIFRSIYIYVYIWKCNNLPSLSRSQEYDLVSLIHGDDIGLVVAVVAVAEISRTQIAVNVLIEMWRVWVG